LHPLHGKTDAGLTFVLPSHRGAVVCETFLIGLESANGGLLGEVRFEVVRDLMLHRRLLTKRWAGCAIHEHRDVPAGGMHLAHGALSHGCLLRYQTRPSSPPSVG